MKKIFSFIFLSLLALVLIGCGDEVDPKVELKLSDADKQITLTIGDERVVSPTLTEGFTLVWESGDSSIVSVTDGTIKALKAGTVTINVSVKDHTDIKATITVIVEEEPVEPVLVDSVTVAGTKEMVVDGKQNLTAEVLPANADNKALNWTSSDSLVATVLNGVVTALKAGTVTITAEAKDGSGAKGTLEITIKDKEPEVVLVTSITLSTTKQSFFENDEFTLDVKVLPENASNKEYTLTSNNDDMILIEEGVIMIFGGGEFVITATAKDGSGVSGTFTFTAVDLGRNIAITGFDGLELAVGDEKTFTASVTPATAKQEVTWQSSDPTVATVDENGLVKCLKAGTFTITATTLDGGNATNSVTYKVIPDTTNITLTCETMVKLGGTLQLTIAVEPVNASREIVWTCKNPEILTVTENGLVTTVGAGVATVVATTTIGKELIKEFTITVVEASKDVVYCDATLTSESGPVTFNNQEFYFGSTAFNKLSDAVSACKGTIYVAAGTYSDDIIIKENNISIIGPNFNVNPNTMTRSAEAIITGKVSINADVKDFTINGMAFTGAGCVDCGLRCENIKLEYNNIFDTNDYSTTWVDTRVELEAVFDFWIASNGNETSNITVNYNRFNNVQETNLFLARVTNVTVIGNEFLNFKYDAIRADGGYNFGDWLFDNNKFVNDTLSGYNGMFFRCFSGIDSEGKCQTLTVTNSVFKNIGNTESTSSHIGAFSNNADQEKGMVINFLYNRFENCVNYIKLRNNGSTTDNWVANVNYNAFIGIPSGVYTRNLTPGGSDTTTSNPILTNFDYNYFEDNEGNPIADLSAIMDKIVDTKSCANNYATKAEYENALKGLQGVDYSLVVNPEWKEIAVDTPVEAMGYTWVMGQTAFASLEEALHAANEGTVILLLAGNYENELSIDKNNITLLGANYNVNPSTENRNNESTITNIITIAENVSGFTVNGFAFTGAGQVKLLNGVSDVKFIYNVMDATSADGILKGAEGASDLVTNIAINFNYSSNYKGNRFGWFFNVDGLEMCNNDITCISCYDFVNIGGMVKGTVKINGNTFSNSLQSFIYCKGVGVANISVEGNYIEDVANTGIDFRDMKEDGAVVYTINYNTFVNAGCGWCPIRVRTAGFDANDSISVTCNYNKFIDSFYLDGTTKQFVENPSLATQADPFKVIYNMNNNYYKDVDSVNNDNFCGAAISWENTYTNEEDVPVMEKVDEIKPTSLEITNKTDKLDALTTYQISFKLLPTDVTSKKVIFESSDIKVATVSSAGLVSVKSSGTVTITVKSVADPSVFDTLVFTIVEKERLEASYEGNGVLDINEELQLNVKHVGTGNSGNIVYTSSDENIATVDSNGKVKGVSAGAILITAKLGTIETVIGLTVIDPEAECSDLMKALIEGNSGVVLNQNIVYIGSDDGTADYLHNIYGSVNNYYSSELPEVIKNMLPTDRENYDGGEMKSIEFIVIHDTAGSGSGSTAKANSGWCTNTGNTGSSWHYTIGNDGIYQQVEDNMVTWHAGDGTSWGDTTVLYDTGVAYEGERPEVTVGNDGFFYINGKKTLVTAPTGTKIINTLGLVCFKGDNGNYVIPTTHVTSGYSNVIAARGGNLNGIGIETAINLGSDVYLTWQLTAKFVATLLVKHDLTPDRVWFHNNFSNKPCPRTMMTASLVDEFLDLVYAEYDVAKNYSDYTITFTSSNPEIIDNTGRIVEAPDYTTNVQYTIEITKGDTVESVVLNALVLGKYNY